MIKNYLDFLNEGFKYESLMEKTIESVTKDCNRYLSDLELELILDDEYDFDIHDDWVAVYEAGSVIEGSIYISINKDKFIEICQEEDFDKREVERQIKISIWHEVGHGLVEYLFEQWNSYCESGDSNEMVDAWHEDWKHIIDDDENDEEIVEEFGIYMADESYITPELYSMIEDFKEIKW